MKGRSLWIIVGMLLLALVSGSSAGAAPKAQRIVWPIGAEVPLDPQHSWSVVTNTIGTHFMEGLVRVHDGKILPGIAKSWDISPDGKTYTFHLRDAAWSDGSKITAYDFEYGMIRLLDPKTAAEYAWAAYYIENAEEFNTGKLKDPSKLGVKAIDEKTFQIRLINPAPYYLGYLDFYFFYPAKREFVAKWGNAYGADADKLLYNGPFILKEWKHEEELILVKNPKYWNKDAIKLDEIRIPIINDPNTAFNMFENGELDIVNIPLNLIPTYLAKGKAQLRYNGANDWIKLNLKSGPAILKNKNFRKALNCGLDREAYINRATKGVYDPATRYILPVVSGIEKKFVQEYPLDFYPKKGDIPKAQQYLKKAMEEMGIKNASDITIEFLIQDDPYTRLMAEALQDIYRQNLGINFAIKQVPYKQKLAQDTAFDYQGVYQGWCPDYDDPMTYLELWISSSTYNAGWSNKKYDDLVDFARSTTDVKKRADAMFEAEKILLEEAVFVPLQFRRDAWLCSDNLKGVVRTYIGADPDLVYAYLDPVK
ncbi:MAG: peptide ABC transporter substrate-binding protein [Clostridia bacterium]|nr:peptide ABC transporter substrate-binding protein [Clostridia bacterium]